MKLIRFLMMSTKKKCMSFFNFFLLVLARFFRSILTYKQISPYFGHRYQMLIASMMISEQNILKALRIQRMIQRSSNHLPWKFNCLTQAMVAVFWCQWYQIPYLLFIGIAKNSKQPLGKDAHAWITAGPVAITGGFGFENYQVVYTYSNLRLFNG